MAPVVVVAHWVLPEDEVDAVLEMVETLRAQSLSEPGCIGYEVCRSVTDPATLVLIEQYADDTAQRAHLDSAHYREIVVERIRPLLVDRRVAILQPRE